MTDFLKRRLVLIALVAVNIPWIIGFAVIENLRENDLAQVERNGLENDCQTAYAVALTDALQDRDTVAVIARAASVELWRTFRELLVNPLPGDQGRDRFLHALGDYLRTLRHVTETADINPYPDLAECFDAINENMVGDLAIKLSSYERHRGTCRGRAVTISGTKYGDVIHGTDKADVIRAGRGVDLVSAGAGKDRICGGNGSDFINAGRGYDRVNCGNGLDSAQQEERRRNCEL